MLGWRARGAAAAVASVTAGVLVIAAIVDPDQEGHGTHEQLGLPPCSWAETFRTPCMTCGMTTSFSHAAEGDLLSSFLVQPAGMLLAVATAAIFWIALYVAATGSHIGSMLIRMMTARVWLAVAGLGIAAWVYKIVTWNSA